jgi:hypothetical protein
MEADGFDIAAVDSKGAWEPEEKPIKGTSQTFPDDGRWRQIDLSGSYLLEQADLARRQCVKQSFFRFSWRSIRH